MYPAIALSPRGRIGKMWIHKDYGAFKVVAKYYYPENPQTFDQQKWRNYLAYGVSYWQSFDDNTKEYYNQLKIPAHMSGYNRFLRLYLNAHFNEAFFWTVKYDANVYPENANPPWGVSISNSSLNLSSGKLHYKVNTGWYTVERFEASGDIGPGVTFETSVKLVAGQVRFKVSGSGYNWRYMIIDEGGVWLAAYMYYEYHEMDTTSDYHIYRVVVYDDNSCELFVDGVSVLTMAGFWPPGNGIFTFFSQTDGDEAYIDYVYYKLNGAVPP